MNFESEAMCVSRPLKKKGLHIEITLPIAEILTLMEPAFFWVSHEPVSWGIWEIGAKHDYCWLSIP